MGDTRDQATSNSTRGQSYPKTPPGECATCPLRAKLQLGVFFDGTGNNKDRDRPKGEHSNVARLWNLYYYEPDSSQAVIYRRWYHFGVGAKDMDEVATQAMEMDRYSYGGMGMGMSPGTSYFIGEWVNQKVEGGFGKGGKERLNKAYEWVKSQLKLVGAEDEKVVDIFGFSRGAALARTFANLVVQGLKEKEGHARLRVRFLGIFDTVASFGKPGDNYNPNQSMYVMNLGATVFHPVARHEQRQNFPLTLCGSADREYAGAHSDVGGGYPPKDKNGTLNHLAYIPFKDMWHRARETHVPLKNWTGESALSSGQIEALRQEAEIYAPKGQSYTPPPRTYRGKPVKEGPWDINQPVREPYYPSTNRPQMNQRHPRTHQWPKGVTGPFSNPEHEARYTWWQKYIHKSHDTGVGMGRDSSGKRRKFQPKQRKLLSLPPGFTWSGEK